MSKIKLEILQGRFASKEDYQCEIGFQDASNLFVPFAKTTIKYNTNTPSWTENFIFEYAKFLLTIHILT